MSRQWECFGDEPQWDSLWDSQMAQAAWLFAATPEHSPSPSSPTAADNQDVEVPVTETQSPTHNSLYPKHSQGLPSPSICPCQERAQVTPAQHQPQADGDEELQNPWVCPSKWGAAQTHLSPQIDTALSPAWEQAARATAMKNVVGIAPSMRSCCCSKECRSGKETSALCFQPLKSRSERECSGVFN